MLQKLQNQPEYIRKIILWAVVVVVGFSLLIWWSKNFQQRIKSFKGEGFQKELKELPKLEIPKK
ncbi:MAG: hypothetical protein Q8N73_01165 [bacterium]|nr:hypothetical protein [bacterium]